MSRYQKGKTNMDFTEARHSEWQWHQLGHMQVCTSLQTDNHTSTPPLLFLQAGCPSCRPTNSVKALNARNKNVPKIVVKTQLIYLLPCIIFEKYIYILALEMASAGNRHCANCVGVLSLPSWWRSTVAKRRSLTGELSLPCARPAADG